MAIRPAIQFAGAFILALALTEAIALGQQLKGLVVGQGVVWQKPEDFRSNYRGGEYAGVIERIDGSGIVTLLDSKAHYSKIKFEQIRSINCSGATWTLDPTGGGPKNYPVCHFTGDISGAYAIADWGAGLTVRLTERVALRDGSTTDTFRSGLSDFGALVVGQGHNRWATTDQPGKAASGGTSGSTTGNATGGQTSHSNTPATGGATGGAAGGTTGGSTSGSAVTQPKVPQKGDIINVPEVGQPYAQALKVSFPATVEAFMSQNDYDTYLFDFPGGSFHAHSLSKLDLVADLLDAEGKMLARSRGTNGTFQFDQNLPQGRYGIIIRVMNHAGTGPYSLLLGLGPGPVYREQN